MQKPEIVSYTSMRMLLSPVPFYDIVFMKKAKVGKMQAWEVNGSLEKAFKKAPVTFLKQNGFVWYFCKCVSDPGSKADCMSMVTGKLRYI